MGDVVKIIVIAAVVLPVIAALLAKSNSPRLAWLQRLTAVLGSAAGFLLGVIVLLVLVLIVYLAWQFSR